MIDARSPEELYDTFWASTVESDEGLSREKVAKALYDFHCLDDRYCAILKAITGGASVGQESDTKDVLDLYERFSDFRHRSEMLNTALLNYTPEEIPYPLRKFLYDSGISEEEIQAQKVSQ